MKPLKVRLQINIGDLLLTQDNIVGYISQMETEPEPWNRIWFTINWFGRNNIYIERVSYSGILQSKKDSTFQHFPVIE